MTTDFRDLRTKMVDNQIRTTDVTDHAVLRAFFEVPREEFVPQEKRAIAYIDKDIAVAADPAPRFLIGPSPLAKLVQLAAIQAGDVVLDIGCATGYSSAVLSRIASSVIAVECDSALAAKATAKLSDLGYDNVSVVEGRLQDGYAPEAPYDVILVGGSVDFVPQALFDQLKDGGRLVAVEGNGNAGVARIYLKEGGAVSGRWAFNSAIPALPGFRREPSFVF